MIKGYSEVPENWGIIAPYVNRGSLVQGIFLSKKCFFYDTCSFRYHANLKEQDAEKILEYPNGCLIQFHQLLRNHSDHQMHFYGTGFTEP